MKFLLLCFDFWQVCVEVPAGLEALVHRSFSCGDETLFDVAIVQDGLLVVVDTYVLCCCDLFGFLLLFSPFLLFFFFAFRFFCFYHQRPTTWRNKILKRLGVNFFYDEILLRSDLESTLSWLQVPTYQGKRVETSYRLGVNIPIHGAFASPRRNAHRWGWRVRFFLRSEAT